MKKDGFHAVAAATHPHAAFSGIHRTERRAAPLRPVSIHSDMPDREAVLTQLDRILRSSDFDASARNRAFLRYVVNETLAGRSEYIKGYTIAQEVFHRDSDFDPQLDPVVRIEASRLRRSLERYYLTAGRRDRIRLDLPKGGYVPRFELSDGHLDADVLGQVVEIPEPNTPALRTLPSVVVLPFEPLGEESCLVQLARGIAEELIDQLLHFDNLIVVGDTMAPRNISTSARAPAARLADANYILKGSVRIAGGRLRVSAHMQDADSGRYVWAQSFDRQMNDDDILATQEDIAAIVANRIASPEGVIAGLQPPGVT
jgi:adenylate cyclase